MLRCCLALACLVPFLVSKPALALFDAQVFTGKRSTKFDMDKSAKESGTELKLAAHLDPIPLVPVGFGLTFSQLTWDKSSNLGFESLDGLEIGAQVQAWLPIELGGFVPYAKLGYTLAGAYVFTNKSILGDYKTAFKPKGVYLNAGVKYLFFMRLGVLLEIEQSTRTLVFDEIKDLPANVTVTSKDFTATNTSFLLGVQAGL